MLDAIDRVKYHEVFCEQNRLLELFLEMRVSARAKITAAEDRRKISDVPMRTPSTKGLLNNV